VTPTVQTTAASSVISGFVLSSQGGAGVPGVVVTLTGDTTTGRTIDVTTTTGGNGAYIFNSVLPGTYNVFRGGDPGQFVGGTNTLVSNLSVGQGQTSSNNNLDVGGLGSHGVSLAFFVSGVSARGPNLPVAGSVSADAFTLNSASALGAQFVTVGSTNYVDLSGNFFDPDTTDTTLTFNTSQGAINVQLFDTDLPQTVTNFLDYVQSGAYNNDLFHRMANLDPTTSTAPQILQGGGFSVVTDNATPANVTSLPALTTTFQPIQNEYSANHPNQANTIAMALSTGPNSATNEFYFNLTDNSSILGPANTSGPFAVFGQVVGSSSQTNLANFATNYTPTDVSSTTSFPNSNAAFASLPLSNGFTPSSTFPTGATVNNLAIINSVTVSTPSQGHLSYKIINNTNPGVVTATLGSNTIGSTFSANQLQLVANSAGSSNITVQITDARGEVVTRTFTVTSSQA
jgi:cyclophilin family peptidyl-prolyl cis-trans isomerase